MREESDARRFDRDLYPAIEPFDEGRLEVGDGHNLYWEASGNPEGEAVVFLHGGPGAGASPEHRRFFDPNFHKIVIFDQRGAGRSRPLASLEENTTQALLADIEALREHLGVESWRVFGGSWGSTLALAYAQTRPERVSALILRGIFLSTKREIDWFLHGMGRIFPEARRKFLEHLPEAERGDPLTAYYRRLTDPDPQVHLPAARRWSAYEGSCSTLLPNEQAVQAFAEPATALGLARLEAHYFVNRAFLAEGELLDGIEKIRHIPAVIVQGRYDIVCPPESADELARCWPEAEFIVVPDAGHSAMEPGIRRALVAATDRLRDLGPRDLG